MVEIILAALMLTGAFLGIQASARHDATARELNLVIEKTTERFDRIDDRLQHQIDRTKRRIRYLERREMDK